MLLADVFLLKTGCPDECAFTHSQRNNTNKIKFKFFAYVQS
jgi:hypothetical protein